MTLRRLVPLALLGALLVSPAVVHAASPVAAMPAIEHDGAHFDGHVVPVRWHDFDRGLPRDAQSERTRRILLNTNRYALQTWYPAKYGAQTGPYLDLGGTAEPNIRPPGSEALALATSLGAPGNLPLGRTTAVTLTVRSTSAQPLTHLDTRPVLPADWKAAVADSNDTTVPPGGITSTTWLVTPSGTAETARLKATASYKNYGRSRTQTAFADVRVPPGLNVALGKQVTVSSVLRATAGGDKAVDGSFTDASRWLSAEGDPAPTLTVDLGGSVRIGTITVHSGYVATNNDPTTTLKDFAFEVHTTGGWQRVAAYTGNVAPSVTARDLDVTGDQVRLAITDPSGSTTDVARVFEFEVYDKGDA